MENNIKSIHIELNGDSDTYFVEISFTEGTIEIPYVSLEDLVVDKYSMKIKGIVLTNLPIKEDK